MTIIELNSERNAEIRANQANDAIVSPLRALRFAACGAGREIRETSYRGQLDRPKCVGVSGDSVQEIILDLIEATEPEHMSTMIELLRSAHRDSLGMGVVLYWPSLYWEEHP